MATTPSAITGYDSRHSDGTPGLEYFTHDTAFAWSGSLADPIEVSRGGYGEPVQHLIDVRGAFVTPAGLREALTWFAKVCDDWIQWTATLETSQATESLPVWAEFDTETSVSRQFHIDNGIYLLHAAAAND